MLGTRASQLRIHPVILRRPCAYRARSEAAAVQNAIQCDPTRLTASRVGEIVGVPLRQALLDESAVLAAMAYVDLNPVRAALCETLEESAHTSARRRLEQHDAEAIASEVIAPIAGVGGQCVVGITATDYLQLLGWTGRQVHPNKRGTLSGPPPRALQRLGHDAALWPRQVLAVGSDFHRAMGTAENLIAKATAMGQRWLQGIGAARRLLQANH